MSGSVPQDTLANLLVRAIDACERRAGRGAAGNLGFETRSIETTRVVPVAVPEQRLETRANMLATNGAQTVLREVVDELYPYDQLRREWSEWGSVNEVRELVAGLTAAESVGHRESHPRPASGGLTSVENYALHTIGWGLQRRDRGRELPGWAAHRAVRLLASLRVGGDLWRCVAPIHNFIVEGDEPIPVTSATTLRRASEEELEELANRKSLLGLLQRGSPMMSAFRPPTWVAETVGEPSRDGPALTEILARTELRALMAALAVYQEAPVDWRAGGCVQEPYRTASTGFENERFPPWTSWSPFEGSCDIPLDRRSALTDFLIPTVGAILSQTTRWLPIASDRLLDARTRRIDRDRIVDAVIALEAVLLYGTRDELKFKLSTRGAALLGTSPEERELVWKTLRSAYDRRSKIVHGDEDSESPPAGEVVALARRVIRRALELTQARALDAVLQELDTEIVRRAEFRR